MTKHRRTYQTLLAVSLATAPVAADPREPRREVAAGPREPHVIDRIVHVVVAIVDAAQVASRPRELPSGAPACGNVATRAASPRRCEPLRTQVVVTPPAPSVTVATRTR